jgi:hypothetical protein
MEALSDVLCLEDVLGRPFARCVATLVFKSDRFAAYARPSEKA